MASIHPTKPNTSSPETRGQRRTKRAQRRAISQTYWAREQQLAQPVNLSDAALCHRMKLLKQHGDFSLAYSTAVQPLLEHFGDDEGYLAYRQRWGVTLALGDPLVAEGQRMSFLRRFEKEFPNPVFCQISRATAQTLADRGYFINEFGVDTILPLADYTFAGKQKEWLRYAANWVNRRDYRVIESDFDAGDVDVDRIETVSEAWRETRTVKRKEVRFLNRPIVLASEPDVRRFFLIDASGQIQAFVFFDPLYRNGKISGYVTAFKRRHPDAPQVAEQAIMKMAIEKMKSEGVPKIHLGLSPFAWIEDREFKRSWFTAKTFGLLFDSKITNHRAYNLIGHAQYKRRFRGVEEKTYYATRSRLSMRSLAALVGLCGIA